MALSDFTVKNGFSVDNQEDATNSTLGGSFTTKGGAAIAKKLFVGGDTNLSGKLKFDSTTNLLTPINGTMEYDGVDLNFTTSNLRKKIAFSDETILVTRLSSSTISGVTLGNNLYGLSAGSGLTYSSGSNYNGSATSTIAIDSTVSLKTDSFYVGTTSIALNRSSGGMTLSGITRIDGGGNDTQILVLQSTTGAGTTDGIKLKVGNNGSTTAIDIDHYGNVILIKDVTINGNIVVPLGASLSINGNVGTNGQILTSNGTTFVWADNTGGAATGFTGSQGQAGGYTGSEGYWGSIGYFGSIGYTGSQGVPGTYAGMGYTGSQGNFGYTGSWGYFGSTGYTGSTGYAGSWGYFGSTGYTGSEGYWGSVGYTGSWGYFGSTGYVGSIGFTGSASTVIGYWGSVGYAGSWGYFGSTGYVGSVGYTGSASTVIGYWGSVGYTGSAGYTGSQGYWGSVGYWGSTGYWGSVGYTGSFNTAATFTFSGTSSVISSIFTNMSEVVTVTASAISNPYNFYTSTQSVSYFTVAATTNWVVNIAHSSGTTMNTALSTGQAISVELLVLQGGTPYYCTAVQVDGTTSGVTTYWQGGTAPTAGNASSLDGYSFSVIKTASATYTVLASQTQFK